MSDPKKPIDIAAEYRRLKNMPREAVTEDDLKMAQYIARKCRRMEYVTVKTAIRTALRQNRRARQLGERE